MLSMEGKGLQGERASPDLCRGGRNMLLRGGRGVGSRGPVISLLLPRYHPVLFGGQGSLYVNTSLPGSPGSGTGRRQRHEGTGFWGTNPRRNSSRGTTCVQGGKNRNKKPHPAHGKTPPHEESTPPRGKKRLPHFHTPKTGVPSEGKNSPRCSKAQVQRREWASLHGKNSHRHEESHVHLSAAP